VTFASTDEPPIRRRRIAAPIGAAPEGPERPSLSLLGPPYRWLQIDCRCYFVENLYVKSADAYFTLPRLDATEAEFWSANDSGENYDAGMRGRILTEARSEALRRAGIPEVYLSNASQIRSAYKPRSPELFPPHEVLSAIPVPPPLLAAGGCLGPAVAPGLEAAEVFAPEFLQIWRAARAGEGLPAALKHVHDSCFESPLLTRDFCMKLKAELRHFKAQGLPHQRPNSMNRNGCILNEIGLGPLMDRIIMLYLLPVCNQLYPEYLDHGLDTHHSFIVDYAVGQDTSLGVHDDNSEITLNVALSEDYSGGTLALYHRARVAHPQRLQKKPYHHRVGLGTMLLHPGELLHEVLPLTAGERQGLIVWLRSDSYRKKHGCALCRRTDGLLYGSIADGGSKA